MPELREVLITVFYDKEREQNLDVIRWLVYLVIMAMVPQALAEFPDSCPRVSQENNCDFYDRCLEAKNQCGNDGYPLGYGLKFCRKFSAMELSAEGERWITATMACLQEQLVDLAETKTDCGTIQTKAFESHVQCYLDHGFCGLPLSDQVEIAGTNFWTTVTSLEGSLQAAEMLATCVDLSN